MTYSLAKTAIQRQGLKPKPFSISLDFLITIWYSMLYSRHNRPKINKIRREIGINGAKRDLARHVSEIDAILNWHVWCHKPNKHKPPHHVTPVAGENKKDLKFRSTKTNKDKIIKNHHKVQYLLILGFIFYFPQRLGRSLGYDWTKKPRGHLKSLMFLNDPSVFWFSHILKYFHDFM